MIVRHDEPTREPLAAERLRHDPRLAEARRLIAQAVHQQQQALTGVRPPQADRQVAYQQLLDRFAAARGGGLFYPYIGSGLGRGPLVELADGSVKYDLIGGIGVHIMGHGHPALLAAAQQTAAPTRQATVACRSSVSSANLPTAIDHASGEDFKPSSRASGGSRRRRRPRCSHHCSQLLIACRGRNLRSHVRRSRAPPQPC